ncbi:hypothetical protein DJ013_02445 [Arcticibacterium luteifluviistationis]|uniref:Uncharacterized protein n=1 Tax=Arcticibacterium luteifluviistationis TaxID=1784714 RepID=A0A2Z4G7E5_9BACT|nr:hypothetical protein DJ013_02445 [Arcticibacterium luteifluviistationis]
MISTVKRSLLALLLFFTTIGCKESATPNTNESNSKEITKDKSYTRTGSLTQVLETQMEQNV